MTIKIDTNKLERFIFCACIFFIFLFNYSGDNGIGKIITNGLIICCICIEGLKYLKTKMIYSGKEVLSFFLFLVVCIFSIFYAYSTKNAIQKNETMIILFLFFVSLLNFLESDENNINYLLWALLFSCTAGCIYLLLKSDWQTGRRVNNILGNSNQVSAYIAYTIPLVLYMSRKYEIKKLFTYLLIALFIFSVAVSGSRSGLIVCVIGIIAYISLTSKIDKNIIFKILFGIAIAVLAFYAAYYLIMNNPALYKIIGRRYVSFFQIINGRNSVINETSTQGRDEMRLIAFNMWTRNIWTFFFGNGINYFASYYSNNGGKNIFCHNNYLEILSGVGITGFAFYFYCYLNPFWNNIVKHLKDRDNLSAMCISMLLEIFLMHYFVVFYYQKNEIVYLALIIYLSNRFVKKRITNE